MSWVDETKAPVMKAQSVSNRKFPDGMDNATKAKQRASAICEYNVQLRRVPNISTNGLHNGFIVQGISRMLVYMAIVALFIPMSLYMMSDIDVIAWYGSPDAKYRVGIHSHALLFFLLVSVFIPRR